ncbi:MAG: nucleotidyltransferase domain-containing protein [Pseudomonadota bacterium]
MITTLRRNEASLRAIGVVGVSLFGSVARGEARTHSDVDLLLRIDRTQRFSVFQLAGVIDQLERILDCPVDVVVDPVTRPDLAREILRDRVDAY